VSNGNGVPIDGHVEPGFEGVADAFRANFALHGDIGAAVALHVEGSKVVDLWGGTTDAAGTAPWREDTLQLVFSTTKGATAVCANMLIERGELDLDAPVARYWPEFAAAGKAELPVRWLLTHEAGLPAVDGTVTRQEALDWFPFCERLAAQRPLWEPGTAHGYHAVTYGYLVGEVVRRVTGRTVGTFFHEEVAVPLGLDFWIGLPESEEHRVSTLVPAIRSTDPQEMALFAELMGPDTMFGRVLSGSGAFPYTEAEAWNLPEVHRAEIPAANGITDARSLSRMYAAVIGEVDGVRLLSPTQVERARTREADGTDQVLVGETIFGLGFMLASAFSPFGGAGTFGHPGAGGSVGFADPERGLALGYVMNAMQQNLAGDPRTLGLVDAVYKAI
jgi:CubicO group peptidase (beta-lactamase class C family)